MVAICDIHAAAFPSVLTHLVLGLKDLSDKPPDRPGDVVHVLGLDGSLDVVLEDLGEVVLELASAEVEQDLPPVWGRVVFAEVGLHLTGQDLQGRRFADAVCPHEAEDLTRPGHGKAMQLEGIGTIAVCGVPVKILW